MPSSPEPLDAVASVDVPSVEELEAMHVPTRRIIIVGTVLWALALLLTLIVPTWHTGSRSWWPWACVTGIVLGALGYAYVARGRGNAATAE